jgi:hypothetical protein
MVARAIFLRLNCVHLGGMSVYFFALHFPSLSFHLTVMSTSMLCSVFVSSRLLFSFTAGASSPEWVKPTAEGAELWGVFFPFIWFAFRACSSVILFCLVVVYMAIVDDGY